MVLAAIGAGLGAGALGGLLAGMGQSRQGAAVRRAGRQGLRAARQAGDQLQASQGLAQAGLMPLQGDYRQAVSNRVQAFGPDRMAARQQGLADAGALQASARDQIGGMIRKTPNITMQGAGLGTRLAAEQLQAARRAPGQAAQQQRLADLFIQPQQQQAGIDFANSMAGINRQSGQILSDDQLRRAQTMGDLGLAQQQQQFAMQDAGASGGFLRALGGFTGGLAPGLTAAMARRPGPVVTGEIPIGAAGPQMGPLTPGYQAPAWPPQFQGFGR